MIHHFSVPPVARFIPVLEAFEEFAADYGGKLLASKHPLKVRAVAVVVGSVDLASGQEFG
jgi:hypothetical protein